MTDQNSVLYVIGGASLGDPLDCVATVGPLLRDTFSDVRTVGPNRDVTLRAMRRSIWPERDRLLYDFTAKGDYGWALQALDQMPAAVLIGARSPAVPAGVMSGLRSARRYAAGGFRFPMAAAIGGLEATPPGIIVDVALRRPAVQFAQGSETGIALAIGMGEFEVGYAVLIALRSANITISSVFAETRRDAEDATMALRALGDQETFVNFVRDRRNLVARVAGLDGLIDISSRNVAGLSDAAFVAHMVGAPVLNLTTSENAGENAIAFAKSRPRQDPAVAAAFSASRSMKRFASDLILLIETGHRRAALAVAAA